MKVKKAKIPTDSSIRNYLPVDYSDVYACEIISEKAIIPDDIMISFWTDSPAWVNTLFKLRNFLVKFVGLKSSEEGNLENFVKCIRTGESYRFVSVSAKSNNETVLLLADSHLNAYLSVHIRHHEKSKKVSAITLVNFKNRLGRIYFFIIRPFHGVVVKSLLKRAITKTIG
ncbi:MAG: DUF2867 domain-containing protein [Tannerella sp.]|jgi:hypothetical protein|nr:DUF2867 domain-containing protein [Tannerella sp.]